MIADQSRESQIWALMGDIAQAVKNKLRPPAPDPCHAWPCPHTPETEQWVVYDGIGLFWSNADGWGGIATAGVFSIGETQVLNLPYVDALGGRAEWVRLSDLAARNVTPHCDICCEPQDEVIDGWGDDWNGDTGCHRSCEDGMV